MSVGPDDVGGLTIKFGGGYEAPWFTPKGSPSAQIEQVKEFFALSADEVEGKAPFEIAVLAASKAQQAWGGKLVEVGLGGKPAGGNARRGRPEVPAAGRGGGGTSQQAEEDPNAGILSAIEAADTQAAISEVYARNASAFEAEQKEGKSSLRDALKAKIKAVKAAAKAAETTTTD